MTVSISHSGALEKKITRALSTKLESPRENHTAGNKIAKVNGVAQQG